MCKQNTIFILLFSLIALSIFFVAHGAECTDVVVTDEEFFPDFISVPVGTCITWKNEGNSFHWPASDFHPTHTIYPTEEPGCIGSGLDACEALRKGESFTFTFNKSGNWGIHDHIHPGITMRIEVTGEDKVEGDTNTMSFFDGVVDFFTRAGKSILYALSGLFNQIASLFIASESRNTKEITLPSKESFRALFSPGQKEIIMELAQANPEEAWEYLKKVFLVNGQAIGNAHEHAHIIGNEAYRQFGFEGVSICDDTFAYGCYHGTTEKLLQEDGPGVIREIEEKCIAMFPPEETMLYTGCIHGSGHGLFSWAGFDTKRALEKCDTFSRQYRPYCYDGVFMEHSSSAPKTDLDPKDPWRFCADFPEQYQHNCARYQVQIFTQLFGWDLAQSIKGCSLAPTLSFQKTCFADFGYVVTQIAKNNRDKIKELCSLSPTKEGQHMCIIGAATELVFQQYTNWRALSETLCKELPKSWEEQCLNTRQNTINTYKRKI